MDILTSLQAENILTEDAVARVESRVDDGTVLEVALAEEITDQSVLRDSLAKEYGLPAYIPADEVNIGEDILGYIPEESARHYGIVPVAVEDGVLSVATNDPDNFQIREVLDFVSNKYAISYKLVFVLRADLEKLLAAYESLTGEVGAALTTLENELDTEIATKQAEKEGRMTPEHIQEDAPVTKIVATVLRYAVDGGASDIHIEPFQGKVRVRFRVDGLLQTSIELPGNVQSAVVARVKILSSMRLDERRKPQDGRFSATFDGRKIDFRVSVLPTNFGEKVVMRILDTSRGVRTLESTGMSEYNLEIIRRAIKEPYGIILISGPTGSGKSTTLYSMLGEVDKLTKNVISLEDPVEYNIDGVSQSQVRPEIGYTFAAGLRSILRQDPDIILVGEIRDKETAQLAIQAALTGHLVFSTIHTNNAIGVIPRLIDMGVDPFLIAPTLKLAIAQRLSRRLCPNSGKEIPVSGHVQEMIEAEIATLPVEFHDRIPKVGTVMQPEPTSTCASGTKGRVAVAECLEITLDIEDLILHSASEDDIYQAARHRGFMTMKEDAIIKALEHVIPFEEVATYGTTMKDSDAPELEEVQPEAVTATVAPTTSSVDNLHPGSEDVGIMKP